VWCAQDDEEIIVAFGDGVSAERSNLDEQAPFDDRSRLSGISLSPPPFCNTTQRARQASLSSLDLQRGSIIPAMSHNLLLRLRTSLDVQAVLASCSSNVQNNAKQHKPILSSTSSSHASRITSTSGFRRQQPEPCCSSLSSISETC
jgi:hypothetical protein